MARNYVGERIKHQRKDNFVEFARGTVDFRFAENGYTADIIVGTTKSGAAVLYDIVNLKRKKIASTPDTAQDRRLGALATNSISNSAENVNGKVQNSTTATDEARLAAERARVVSVPKKTDEGRKRYGDLHRASPIYAISPAGIPRG